MAKKRKGFVQNPGNTAICYYRYSSDAQRDCSIEQQKEAAEKYASENGLKIIKEYKDRAISGTRSDRAEYQLMLSEVNKLKPSYLILWKTDRLSRDRYESIVAKALIRNAGCKVVYVAEQIPEDEGVALIIESLYEAMSEQYVINLRENVLRGMHYNAENAIYNGRKLLGYIGKPNTKYQVDNNTAPIVKNIFQSYADGTPLQTIVENLNNSGLKSVRGNDFTINSLRSILLNRAYIGEYHFGDYYIPDGMPRIISDDLFNAVQLRFERNKRGSVTKKRTNEQLESEPNVEFWLTENCRCGLCGSPLHGISGTAKNGSKHYYYACLGHRKHRCNKKNVRKEDLELVVDYAIDNILNDSAMRLLIASHCFEYYKVNLEDNSGIIKAIKSSINDVQKRLDNIMKAIEAGIFNDTTASRMEELQTQKEALIDELEATEARSQFVLTLADIVKFLDTAIQRYSKRELLEMLIEKIYVFDDKVDINFFFTDDKRELNIEEVRELLNNRNKILDGMDRPKKIDVNGNNDLLWSLIGKDKKPDSFS